MPCRPSVFGSIAMPTLLLRVSSSVYRQEQVGPVAPVRGVPVSRLSVESCAADSAEQGSDASVAALSGFDTFGADLPPARDVLVGALPEVAPDPAALAVPPVLVVQPAVTPSTSASAGRRRRCMTRRGPSARCLPAHAGPRW